VRRSWPLGEVGANLDVRESNLNYLEIVGTWDERIVMVADDEDFLEWQRDWLTNNGRG
jgi:hypothetical protein